jgi:hypothetical protein
MSIDRPEELRNVILAVASELRKKTGLPMMPVKPFMYSSRYMMVRYEARDTNGEVHKEVLPFYDNSVCWQNRSMPAPRILYNLPRVRTATHVFVVEGEKTADFVNGLGFDPTVVATTSPHGASSPYRTDWAPLSNKHVVILPDNDKAGRKYKEYVLRLLIGILPQPKSVRIIRLQKLWPPEEPLFDGADIADLSMPAGELRTRLIEAIKAAKPISLDSVRSQRQPKLQPMAPTRRTNAVDNYAQAEADLTTFGQRRQGDGGSTAVRVARYLRRGYLLSATEAMELFRQWNARNKEPYSATDLQRKFDAIDGAPSQRPDGFRLRRQKMSLAGLDPTMEGLHPPDDPSSIDVVT